MSKITNILMVGVGGQGIILASDIISLAAMLDQNDVKKSEIHGMSQRGGSVFSHIRFGEKVHSPLIPHKKADILISLEEMETLRWLQYTNTDTKIIYAKTQIKPSADSIYPEGIETAIKKEFETVYTVHTNEIKEKTGNAKFFNVVLLGLISNFIDIQDKPWHDALNKEVPEGTYDANLNAFNIGKDLA